MGPQTADCTGAGDRRAEAATIEQEEVMGGTQSISTSDPREITDSRPQQYSITAVNISIYFCVFAEHCFEKTVRGP